MGAEASVDFEGLEFYVRSAMLRAGATVLERVLAEVGRGRRDAPMVCADNHLPRVMQSLGLRDKRLRTILGSVRFRRSAYRCPECGAARYPGDEALGVVGTSFSPGARRLMADGGSDFGFRKAAKKLRLYAGLDVGPKDVERVAEQTGAIVAHWMERQGALALLSPPVGESPPTLYVSYDGTGVPVRKDELTGVRGKRGAAKTREVKLGCVFTQTDVDEEGRPVRDENSTTYCAAIEPSVDFGHRIHQEAMRRGMASAGRVVVITDGAAYNKSIVAEHFPDALHILDLYHAREHLGDFFRDTLRREPRGPDYHRLRNLLDAGDIEKLTAKLQSDLPRSGPRRKAGEKQIAYFHKNAHAMRYAQFRAMGLFIGSGVVEAGCRTIVTQRLKNSGMFWSLRGANAILALRCTILSNRFEQFWEDQAA